jgi:hypothetical protein
MPILAPEFARAEFLRSFHCGCFPMWRKSICDNVGLFDSQLRSGADFDLMIRIAASAEMQRAHGLLGYYLNAGMGLSTSGGRLQPTERTVVELRYGIYDKIDYRYLPQAREYRWGEIYFDGCWHPVSELFPDYEAFLHSREHLRRVGLRNYRRAQVRRLASSVRMAGKEVLRRLLARAGLLDWARSLGRERA